MKKFFWFFIFLLFLAFPVLAYSEEISPRALFVSVIQDPPVFSSRENIADLINFSKRSGTKVLFVQVYRANKAWFPSKLADSAPYKECFKNVSEDPFTLLIKEAHTAGIEVHAWLNLMSLSTNEAAPMLKRYGPEILTQNLEKKRKLADYKIDGQYFLEPGDTRVREELSTIVGEVVSAYPDLDGIQFDYIRYPDAHPHYGFTKMNRERFKKATGQKKINEESEAWKKWKCDQVTDLLKTLAHKARSIHPGIQVSTTGLMPYSRARWEAFQDWRLWLKSGLTDFVTLMCYHIDDPTLQRYIEDAKDQLGDLKNSNIAVGAYTFLDSPKAFVRQFDICEESKPRSCAVLHYGNFLENPELALPLTRGRKSS